MKNYNCEYSREGKKLDIGDNWYKTIEANNPREAYEKFIKDVGVFQKPVIVDGGNFLKGPELFSDHIEAAEQSIHEKEKTEVGQSEFQGTNQLEDPEIQYQDGRGKPSEGITKKQGTYILILLLAGLGLHPLSQVSMPAKWEYMIAAPSDSSFENEMDRLGKKGWELINARRASSSYSESYECILKRKVSVLNFGKK
jgi:hypothetical protein